jgi:hypothetical protein
MTVTQSEQILDSLNQDDLLLPVYQTLNEQELKIVSVLGLLGNVNYAHLNSDGMELVDKIKQVLNN